MYAWLDAKSSALFKLIWHRPERPSELDLPVCEKGEGSLLLRVELLNVHGSDFEKLLAVRQITDEFSRRP